MNPKNLVHVILVEPGDNLNMGSVARLMSNLGFEHLHIVNPPRFDRAKAEVTACWGKELLDRAVIHTDLASALSGMEDVVAFSTRTGKNRAPPLELIPWVSELRRAPKRTALLFGPEDTGLLQHHIELARITVVIPSNTDNKAFNLANAVLLALYEIAREEGNAAAANSEEHPSVASQHQQLDRMVVELAELSGFYHQGTSQGLKSLMKNLTRRSQPNEREMNILLGLFGCAVKKIKAKE